MQELHYIEAFSSLHTAKVEGYKAPHKAVLLLAIIDLVENGVIREPRIQLSDELEKKFNELWHHYLGTSVIFKPDITKPYFHMQYESFWQLVEHDEVLMMADDSSFMSSNKKAKELPRRTYSVKAMRKAFAYAKIDNSLFQLLQNADVRAMLRVILINEYLTNQPNKTMSIINQLIIILPLLTMVA